MYEYMYMETLSYTYVRNNFVEVSNKVCDDHVPVVVTRQGAPSVVILSLDDYRAMDETAYLLRSSANASRLLESIAADKRGEGTVRDLIEAE